MDIFQFVNRLSTESCLIDDELYISEGKWVQWEQIQKNPLDVVLLKEMYGDQFSISLNFVGNILMKIGVSSEGKLFIWCGEKTFTSENFCIDECIINLNDIKNGVLQIFLYGIKESAIFDMTSIALSKDIKTDFVLYDFLFPTYELCCEEHLYYHFLGERAYYSFTERCIHLGKGSSVDLLTYFNSFSAIKWKKYTNVECISIYLDFIGKARAEIVHVNKQGEHILATWKLQTKQRSTFELPIRKYPNSGILGLNVFAEQECVVYGGGYLTDAPETQTVRLGIGITSYHRENAVKTSVERLGKAISAHPLYQNIIDITVVDNGKTLVPQDIPAATLIQNRNLGGTGGFVRNLIHYQDTGKYSHCLFMDDDAFCEVGSIFRSISFLRHVNDMSISINGAMLSENIQFIQWENGAWFDKGCHPLHCNYDLRHRTVLLDNEDEDCEKPIYGAWWFFIFPIKSVSMYSFPFFVRGDDIEFSYTNKFKIVRLNGVSIWQEDFKIKESPMTLYFDIRSHIIHHLVLEELDYGAVQILKMLWTFFHRFNWAYQYDTANAIVMSFSDMLEGPKYWLDNIDTIKIRKRIKEKSKMEISHPLRENYRTIPEALKNVHLPFCTKLIRRLSLNGHLLPCCMVRKGISRLNKYQVPFINRVFLRDEILVCNEINNTEMILRRNSIYFIKNIYTMIINSIYFLYKYNKLKRQYRIFISKLKKDNFWRDTFNK